MEILQETEFSIRNIQYLILDEADKLFEKSYVEQIENIIEKIQRERQTILMSATIPSNLKDFGKAGMREYSFVKLDSEYTLNDNLEMHFLLVKNCEKIPLTI